MIRVGLLGAFFHSGFPFWMILLAYFDARAALFLAAKRPADLHQSEAWLPILRLQIFPIRTDRFPSLSRTTSSAACRIRRSFGKQRVRCLLTRSRVSWADTKKAAPPGRRGWRSKSCFASRISAGDPPRSKLTAHRRSLKAQPSNPCRGRRAGGQPVPASSPEFQRPWLLWSTSAKRWKPHFGAPYVSPWSGRLRPR